MKTNSVFFWIPACIILWFSFVATGLCGSWDGVDKTVVEKFAQEAGRAPRQPFINTDQGDLLLFVFLVAGTAGGFLAGYCFRGLFGQDSKKKDP